MPGTAPRQKLVKETNAKGWCDACRKTAEQGAENIFSLVWQWVAAWGKQHPWKGNNPMAILRRKVISEFACD